MVEEREQMALSRYNIFQINCPAFKGSLTLNG